jgi:hypothetical protein
VSTIDLSDLKVSGIDLNDLKLSVLDLSDLNVSVIDLKVLEIDLSDLNVSILDLDQPETHLIGCSKFLKCVPRAGFSSASCALVVSVACKAVLSASSQARERLGSVQRPPGK